jgi:hypothetical protein
MTRTDADLERDLRAMLHRRALDVPEVEPEVVPSLATRRGDTRWVGRRTTALVALAAAMAVALPVAVVLVGDDDGSSDATTEIGPATEEPGGGDMPFVGADGTPLRAAAPVFVADGSPEEVALAYLSERMIPELVRIDGADQVGDTALVRWSALDDAGVGTPGTVELHRVDGRWGVFASTSSAITVDVAMSGETLTGTVSTTDDAILCVDVVTPIGAPVPGSPFPEGNGGATLLGTAGCATGTVDVSLVIGLQPVVVRASLVGGGVLAVAETRLDAPLSTSADDRVATTVTWQPGASQSTMAATTTQPAVPGTGPVIDRSTIRVQVVNAAGVQGMAGAQSEELAALGYPIAEPDTSDVQLADTRIYAHFGFEPACEAVGLDLMAINSEVDLAHLTVQTFDPATTPVQDNGMADCFVVLGQDLAHGTVVTSSPVITTAVATTTTVVPPAG